MSVKKIIPQILEYVKPAGYSSLTNGCYRDDYWKKEVIFHENGNVVHFRDPLAVTGIITNIVRTTKHSENSQINQLIKKLNDSYNRIKHITEEEIHTL